MNTFLVFASIIIAAMARPDGLLDGNDGHVSVTQNSLGTYKYTVHLKDSIRSEERLADGTIFGEYTIPGDNGVPLTIKYTSGRDGFRILEGLAVTPVTAPLPVAPVETVVPVVGSSGGLVVPLTGTTGVFSQLSNTPLEHILPVITSHDLPVPVEDTPEVKAAKEHFFALHRAAAALTAA